MVFDSVITTEEGSVNIKNNYASNLFKLLPRSGAYQ